MSGIWEIIENSKTSDTGYIIAKLVTAGGGTQILNGAQLLPASPPFSANGTSVAFNTEGYGHGVTISYQVRAGTSVIVILDVTNDPLEASTSWVATEAKHESGTRTFFLATKHAWRGVRLRIVSGVNQQVSVIRVMADS